jgi:hypothetical protein
MRVEALSKRTGTSRTFVALAAAFVLVLQAFATAWAAGVMPSGPMLDAFGNPLCITSTDQQTADHDGPAGDHSKMPNCCTMGCSNASALLATPADDSGAWLPVRLDAAEADFRTSNAVFVAFPDHDPGSPRAPPPTV